VFDEHRTQSTALMLFPDGQEVPADAVNAMRVKLDQMQLCRPRAYGNCWLGCRLGEMRQQNVDYLMGTPIFVVGEEFSGKVFALTLPIPLHESSH
jgi:hypothetical protein